MKTLLLTGLNHNTAPVEIRETFALGPGNGPGSLPLLSAAMLPDKGRAARSFSLLEHMVLSTCNRVEIIGVGLQPDAEKTLLSAWAESKGRTVEELAPYVYVRKGPEAVEHVLTVASGLDSMIIGEPQILGQMKEAYRQAAAERSAGLIINRLMHKAFFVGKRARTETDVARNPLSVSYAAVELAKQIFTDMSQVRCLLLGAGETAELAAKYLLAAEVKSITVANRTLSNARRLALRYNGRAIKLTGLPRALAECDMVITSSSSPEPVITEHMARAAMKKRGDSPMFFVDIAVPRNVAPEVGNLNNVHVYDIDDLKNTVTQNLRLREKEAAKARDIIEAEKELFCNWLKSLALQPTIMDVIKRGETIAKEELNKALERMGPLPEESVEVLETMVRVLVKKLHHDPVSLLKQNYFGAEAGEPYLTLARRMFNLDDASPAGEGLQDDSGTALQDKRPKR